MATADRSNIWFAVINGYAASKDAGAMWGRVEELMKTKGIGEKQADLIIEGLTKEGLK